MNASFGRYLDVDLSTGGIRDYEIPKSWAERHLGGRGIGARLLLDLLTGREAALSPKNVLVFATGPFQGTGLLGAGRHVVMGISPKTGSVADSYVGGYLGHELGRSGYDGILLRGKASAPIYLTLIDGAAKLHPARDVWGKGTGETETILKARHPGGRVASIGIAGENLVQMACIIHDRSRAAGRPGFGAVMGSKLLKAIVVRGNTEKSLHDRARFARERAQYAELSLEPAMKRFGEYGTAAAVASLSELGLLPTKNFQEGVFDQAAAIDGVRLHDTILVGRETCAACAVRCKRVVKTRFGSEEVFPEFGGPEYETIAAFGSLCLVSDLAAIALANQRCNDYGVDTISAGVAAAFLMEASERGLVTERMSWGDGRAIVALVDAIARREGIGDRIAEGLERFAASLGVDFAMTIKGVEIPMHEPRGKQGLGISYATSPRGAAHMEGMHDTMLETDAPAAELGVDRRYDRFTLADKPAVAKMYEDLRSFENSLVLCAFTSRPMGKAYRYPAIRSLLEAATGISLAPQGMLEVGERNYALMRVHRGRAGYTTDEDALPGRFAEPLPRGASAGHPISKEEMARAIAAYYERRGYDRLGPTDATLARLDLLDCVGILRR